MYEEHYLNFIDNINDGIYQINTDGYFAFVNKAITDTYGIAREEFCRLHFLEVVDPKYHDLAKINFQRVMVGKDGIPYEHEFKDASGQARFVEVRSSPIREGERVVGLMGIARDITGRKQAEKALQESELRFRLAAESSSDLIWEWDIITGELKWFGPIDKLLGYEVGEFPRTIDAWEKIIHHGDHDRVMAKLDQHLEDGTPYFEEYRVLRKDGAILYWTDRGTAVRNQELKSYKMVGAVTDITELKLTEEKLKASERQFRGLVESIPIGIFTYEGTKFQYVNPAFEKMTGYTRDELYLGDVWDIIHPEFKDGVKEFARKRQRGEPVPVLHVLKIVTKSGEERWVERGAITIEVNETPSVLITVTDITERKQAEEELRESEQLFQTLTQRSLVGIYVVQDGLFMSANPNAASYAGYTPEDLVGKKSNSIVHPEDREIQREGAISMLKEKRSSPCEFRIIGKNGETHWIMETVTPIIYKGRPAILGNSMDITQRRQMDEVLRKSEEKYHAVLENASDAIVLARETGNIVEVNKKAEELLGYTREDLLQMHYTQLHPMKELERTKDAFDKIVEEGHAALQNGSICRKDGKVVPVDITASAIQYAGMNVIQGSFRDISEHKHTEDSLERLVGKRTAELSEKNEQLVIEIKERKRAEASLRRKGHELRLHSSKLEKLNAALKILLKQRDEDKRELEDKVMANVRELILPYLEELKGGRLDARGKVQVSIIEANLNNIISPFMHRLSTMYSGFSPREIQVANLIKQGKSTKEIAEYVGVSRSAINLYRNKIRKKLGISRKINLRSHLMTLS